MFSKNNTGNWKKSNGASKKATVANTGKKATVANKRKAKNPADSAPIKKAYNNLQLSKLKENMVGSGYLTSITTEIDGVIELSNSWAELSLLWLGMIHYNNKLDYLKVLLANKVLSDDFDVTTIKKLSIDNNSRLETIKIAGTKFYLNTTMESKSVRKALLGMASALEINKDDIKLTIVPLSAVKTALKLTEGTVTNVSKQYTLVETYKIISLASNIRAVYIYDTEIKVKSFSDATMTVVDLMIDMYGAEEIEKASVCNTEAIGITDNSQLECIDITSIKGIKNLYLYDNKSDKQCIEFMISLCNYFNLSEDVIKIELGQLNFIKN